MNENKKQTFVFNKEWYDSIAACSDAVRLSVFEAIVNYAVEGREPALDGEARMAFTFIRRQIDYNARQYETTVEKRREAGRKSARLRREASEAARAAAANSAQHRSTNANHIDNDIESDNDTETDIDSVIETESDSASSTSPSAVSSPCGEHVFALPPREKREEREKREKKEEKKPQEKVYGESPKGVNSPCAAAAPVAAVAATMAAPTAVAPAAAAAGEVVNPVKILAEITACESQLQGFCQSNGLKPEEFGVFAAEILNEWALNGTVHTCEREARRHLVNHIRVKANMAAKRREQQLKAAGISPSALAPSAPPSTSEERRARIQQLEAQREQQRIVALEREAAEEASRLDTRMRYSQRVPGAFTPSALLTFSQYQINGFDRMSDADFDREFALLASGAKTLPTLEERLRKN